MLKSCFVDSSCWIALLNRNDELHHDFDEKYKKIFDEGCRFVTTSSVITEVANSLSKIKFRKTTIEFYKRILSSETIKIVFIDEKIWSYGWELFSKRLDKEWSLTDCISMIVMKQSNIENVLTADDHFAQAGFIVQNEKKR